MTWEYQEHDRKDTLVCPAALLDALYFPRQGLHTGYGWEPTPYRG